MTPRDNFKLFADNILRDLKTKPFDELIKLNGQVYSMESRKRIGKVAIAIESDQENSIKMVLQGSMPLRLFRCIEYPIVDGFRKHKNGKVEAVTYDEISYYD